MNLPFLTVRGPAAYMFTFLTKPRRWTQDAAKADRARAMYGEADWPGAAGWYSTSVLGMLNGWILHPIGLSLGGLVTEPPHGGRYLLGYEIVRGRHHS